MAGNPRENVKDKGFWDGGAGGHGSNKESSGRPSGFPGTRRQRRVGISTDIEFPDENENAAAEQDSHPLKR
ncbi:MAG: hypothetical protein ACXW2F_07960 [Thermoanaerobaculia bacterium]